MRYITNYSECVKNNVITLKVSEKEEGTFAKI